MLPRFLAVTSLAILGSLAAVATAQAQTSRLGTYLYQNQPSYSQPSYSQPSYYSPSTPTYPAAGVGERSRTFYPGSAEADKVLINVTVPADAKIMFQGAKTTQTGGFRRFLSPTLAAGYRYSYSVQATWLENGREVSQSRSVAVQPGDVLHITFTRAGVDVRSGN